MKHAPQKLLAAALATALLFTACGGGGTTDDSATDTVDLTTGATGRYMEEKLNLPENLVEVYDIWMEDGRFNLLAMQLAGGGAAEIKHFVSEDGGTWSDLEVNFSLLDNGDLLRALTQAPDGSYYAGYAVADEPDDDGETTGFSDAYLRLHGGALEDLPYAVRYPHSLLVLENGDVLVTEYGVNVCLVDGQSGALKYNLSDGEDMNNGFIVPVGDGLAVSKSDGLYLYELAGGTHRITLPLETDAMGSRSVIYPADETGQSWYYANVTGIYKTQQEGALTERLVDGGLTSLALPTQQVRALFVKDSAFYVFLDDKGGQNGPALYRYSYDETVPATPDTLLRVYSLEDSPTLRMAVNVFQRQNPEAKVQYEFGYTAESGQTVDDALKALATVLMSDSAPDVIMMDGLPLQSYLNKGVLMDLSPYVEAGLRAGLYENIAFVQDTGEGVYTIAGRFAMPMLFAQEADKGVFDTPETLADYITAQEVPIFGYPTESFMRVLYPLYGSRWLDEGYNLNAEALGEDLVQLRRISELYDGQYYDGISNIPDYDGDIIGGSLLSGVLFPVYLGELRATGDLIGPFNNSLNQMPHQLYTLPNGGAPLFRPLVNMGIAATSEQPELAMQFILAVLDEETQSQDLGDGVPVNRAVVEASYAYTGTSEVVENGLHLATSWGWGYYNPFTGEQDVATLLMYWPSQEYFEENALWEQAEAPLWEDRTVLEILESECTPYLRGQTSLEACLQALEGRLNLLAAENMR